MDLYWQWVFNMADQNKLNEVANGFFKRMQEADQKPSEAPATCEHCGAVSMPVNAPANPKLLPKK